MQKVAVQNNLLLFKVPLEEQQKKIIHVIIDNLFTILLQIFYPILGFYFTDDITSYDENVKKLFVVVSDFGSVEDIKFLWKATFEGRRMIIGQEQPDIDWILKSLCPVLNQELYVSKIRFYFCRLYATFIYTIKLKSIVAWRNGLATKTGILSRIQKELGIISSPHLKICQQKSEFQRVKSSEVLSIRCFKQIWRY